MKLFGSIGELVSLVFRLAGGKEVRVTSAAQTGGEAGVTPVEIEIPDVGAGGSDVLVTEAASQALTNKTIDASANSISNLAEGDFETKLADANKALVRDAAGDVTSALITNVNVDAAAAIAESKLDLDYPTSSLNSAIDGKLDNFTSANDSRIVLTDGTSGDALKESAVVINGLGQMSGVARLDVDNVRVDGNTISSTDANGPITLEAAGTATVKGVGGDVILDATDDAVQIKAANVLVRDGAEIVLYDESDVNALTLSVPAALTSSKSVAFPDLAGTVALTSGAQVITDKDIDGGTASDTSRITLPKAAKSALDELERKEATLVYASDEDKVYVDDGSNLIPVGSDAAGSGEKTYIENPSASVVITGWTNVGDLDVERTTDDLPREYTTGTGIKITADANTQSTADYVYYDFTLDEVDLNKKLKIQWAQKQTGSYVAGNLAVVITTQADRTTALHTPETTNIPAYDGVFQTSFDSGSTATLSLVIRATTDMATGAGIVISDVIVGPGQIQAVPPIGTWQSYTPTFSAAFGVVTLSYAQYRREIDSVRIRGKFTTGTVTAGAGSVSLPSGLTVSIPATTPLGDWRQAGLSTDDFTSGSMLVTNGLTVVEFADDNSTAASTGTPFSLANVNVIFRSSTAVSFDVLVPIAEWAGAPNYAGQNDVEYAYSAGTWDSAGDTTTAYGPQGQAINSTLAATRDKTITWRTPIQVTDRIQLWFSKDRVSWYPGPEASIGSSNLPVTTVYDTGGSILSGARFLSSTSTTTTIRFQRYLAAGNDDTPLVDWPTSDAYWVATKAKAGAAVGFGHVAQNSSGLVKSAGQLLGTNTNDSAAAGYVGEYFSASSNVSAVSSDYATAVTLSFSGKSPGDFDISASVGVGNLITTQSDTRSTALLTDPADTSSSGQTIGFTRLVANVQTGSGTTARDYSMTFPQIRATWDGTNITLHRDSTTEVISGNTIAIRIYCGVFTVGSATAYGFISARRVR